MAVWSLSRLTAIRSNCRVDSEFFRPEYLLTESSVRDCECIELGQLGGFVPGPFGSAFRVRNYDFKSPYRYIRGKDVKPFFLLNDDNRYLPVADFHRLRQYEVLRDDLMISVVGTLGNVAICTDEDVPAMFSCKSTLFRSKQADPYFLLAYLNSAPGLLCMLRRQRGAIQAGLNMEDLRTIPVPRFGDEIEMEIAADVRAAHRNLIASRQTYEAAQQLLESALGLDKLSLQRPMGYIANFSEAFVFRRFDADYFQTPYRQIDEHLGQFLTAPLHILADITKGIEVGSVAYQTKGHPFLRVSNVRATGIELGASDKYISTALYSELESYRPQIGEILLTKDGSPGVATALDQECDGIISGGIVRLELKSNDIPNEYLALVINSLACQMQIQRECSGALILHWKPTLIRKLRIPLLPDSVMHQIANLVTESKRARRKSDELLAQAKTRVEQLIEAAVKP